MTIVPTLAGNLLGGNLISTQLRLRYVPAGPQFLRSVETWFPRRQFQKAVRASEAVSRAAQKSRFPTSSAAQAAPRSVHHG